MNFYETMTLLQAVEKLPPTLTFLKDTFFPRTETFVTEKVLLDIRKGSQKMAPFVAPRVGGVTMERDGFSTREFKAPRIAPQRPITIDDLSKRSFGESVVSSRTPAQRQAAIVAKDLQDFNAMIARREEWMAAQVLFYGRAVLKGYVDHANKNFVEQEIDYQFENKETLLLAERWGHGGDIYTNLEEWRLDVLRKTGEAPTVAVLGRQAAVAMRNDEKLQKLLDIRNLNIGQMNPEIRGNGVTYLGRLSALGLDLLTYDAWFQDDDGQAKPFVPEDHIMMGTPGLGSFAYGAVTQMEKDDFLTYEGVRVPKVWSDHDNEVRMMRLSSRPLPKPDDVHSWFVAKVV